MDNATTKEALAILRDQASSSEDKSGARKALNTKPVSKPMVPKEAPIVSQGPIESLPLEELKKARGGSMNTSNEVIKAARGGKPVGVGAAERGFGAVRMAAKGGKVNAMSRGVAKKGFGKEVR